MEGVDGSRSSTSAGVVVATIVRADDGNRVLTQA
jgi:hypothetical protein